MDDDRDLPDATPERDYDTLAELPVGEDLAGRPKVPSTMPPPGSCDGHVRMPAGDPSGPQGFEAWIERAQMHFDTLGLGRGVLVQSAHDARDDTMVEALARLGPEYRGVALAVPDMTGEMVDRLARRSVTGVRLDLGQPDRPGRDALGALAPLVAAHGMHVRIVLGGGVGIGDLADDLRAFGMPVVVEAMGAPDIGAGPGAPAFDALVRLVADGVVHVDLAIPAAAAPWEETDAFVAALVAANPDRCIWGSGWPHPGTLEDDKPDAGRLLDAFFRAVEGTDARQKVLVDTPAALYGF